MAPQGNRAITIDALGTLLELQPPAPRLRAGLRERHGIEVRQEVAERAVREEIAYYRTHLHEGRDAEGLAALRRRCAEVVHAAIGAPAIDLDALTETLLAAIRFEPFADAAPALRELRARGVRLVALSNWDVSLHEQLAATGLSELLDGALSSAEAGIAKPDPALFARALALAGARARDAWHVGDDLEADVGGALAAGLRPVLVDREGGARAPAGVPVIGSLAELPALCA